MNYAQLLFPDFSLILCGYLVCRFTALNRSVWQQVESLVYFFLFPVLLFHSIVRSPLDLGAASSLIAAGLSMGVLGIALAYSLPYLPGLGAHIDRREHAGSAQVAFRFNSFIALALAERLAGAMSCFRPGGGLGGIGAYIGYSPYCVPRQINGIKCVIVNEALRDIEPMAWDFVMNFARDNLLQVAEACLLPEPSPRAPPRNPLPHRTD